MEGLSHYRLGDFAAALSAALSAQLRIKAESRAPRAENIIVLAMAQHEMGQREEALKTLDEARLCHSHLEMTRRNLLAEAEEKLAIPLAADNPDGWIGRRYMPRDMARITEEAGRPALDLSMPLLITRVEGDRLGFGSDYSHIGRGKT